jgi:hypothetical protein
LLKLNPALQKWWLLSKLTLNLIVNIVYQIRYTIVNRNVKTMAKPIKNTPVLEGKDAINFFSKLQENKDKKVDKAYLLSIREEAKKLQSIFRPR